MIKKLFTSVTIFILLFFFVTTLHAQEAGITFLPTLVIQGEPLMIQVIGVATSSIKNISFDGKSLGIFTYTDKPTALVGIDLNKKPGVYVAKVELFNGSNITSSTTVNERKKIVAPLGIPEKLGGDTVKSQNKMVSTLSAENKTLQNIRTSKKAFWTSKFIFPLNQILVTDPYGYSRETGSYSIPHKGTDYRAAVGTPVIAINRGVVRIVKTSRNYGKMVVIDHGLGVQSFYLHLSKIKVIEGQLVESGEEIGLSGQTGYVLGPHLHLSIRINNSSIDPVKFFDLFH